MRTTAGVLAAALSLTAFAQDGSLDVPPAQLQLLSSLVEHIKDDYAGPVDEPRLAGVCAAALRMTAKAPAAPPAAKADFASIPRLLSEAKRMAPAEVTHEDLAHACAKGMALALDDHSQFLDPARFRELQVGNPMAAIGIEIGKRGDAVMVLEPIDGAPAQRAGIRAGDRLVSVDGEPFDGLSLEAAARALRGRPGSEAIVTVERPGVADPMQFSIKRQLIRIRPRVEWLEGDILYLQFRQMNSAIGEGLVRSLEQMVNARAPAGIVLDLRDNTGGLLRTTTEIAGLFLQAGSLVGATKGKRGEEFKASRRSAALSGVLQTAPMVVLVNGKTASGGEILAAALQAHRRARLVGTPTFGMGSIQTIMPLGGNTALKLTTHYWMAPGERMLEGNPLQPDVNVASDDALKVRDTALELLKAEAR